MEIDVFLPCNVPLQPFLKGYKSVLSMLDTRFESFINAAKIQVNCGEEPFLSGKNNLVSPLAVKNCLERVSIVTFSITNTLI
jgi:hypothetical protein